MHTSQIRLKPTQKIHICCGFPDAVNCNDTMFTYEKKHLLILWTSRVNDAGKIMRNRFHQMAV